MRSWRLFWIFMGFATYGFVLGVVAVWYDWPWYVGVTLGYAGAEVASRISKHWVRKDAP